MNKIYKGKVNIMSNYEYAKKSTERTIRWAKRGLDAHKNENQSLRIDFKRT